MLHHTAKHLMRHCTRWLISFIFLFSIAMNAHAATYDFMWKGTNGVTMRGMFGFDDTLSGVINITPANVGDFRHNDGFFLMFNARDKFGNLLGSFSLREQDDFEITVLNFTFNFDTTTGQFVVGGGSGTIAGQNWIGASPDSGTGHFGFVSGTTNQHLTTSPIASPPFIGQLFFPTSPGEGLIVIPTPRVELSGVLKHEREGPIGSQVIPVPNLIYSSGQTIDVSFSYFRRVRDSAANRDSIRTITATVGAHNLTDPRGNIILLNGTRDDAVLFAESGIHVDDPDRHVSGFTGFMIEDSFGKLWTAANLRVLWLRGNFLSNVSPPFALPVRGSDFSEIWIDFWDIAPMFDPQGDVINGALRHTVTFTITDDVIFDNAGPLDWPGAGTGGFGTFDNFTVADDFDLQGIHWWGDCDLPDGCVDSLMTIDLFEGRPVPSLNPLMPPETLPNLIHTFSVGKACMRNLGPIDWPPRVPPLRELYECSAQLPDIRLHGNTDYWFRIKDDMEKFGWSLSSADNVPAGTGAFQGQHTTDPVFNPIAGGFAGVAFNIRGTIVPSAPPGPIIGPNSIIGEGTTIEDGVVIGADAQVGSNVQFKQVVMVGNTAVIGDETIFEVNVTVGDDFNAGFKVMVEENVVIGDFVSIGDNSVIKKGTLVEDHASIGAFVTIGDGATIKAGAVVADGDIVPAGATVFP